MRHDCPQKFAPLPGFPGNGLFALRLGRNEEFLRGNGELGTKCMCEWENWRGRAVYVSPEHLQGLHQNSTDEDTGILRFFALVQNRKSPQVIISTTQITDMVGAAQRTSPTRQQPFYPLTVHASCTLCPRSLPLPTHITFEPT